MTWVVTLRNGLQTNGMTGWTSLSSGELNGLFVADHGSTTPTGCARGTAKGLIHGFGATMSAFGARDELGGFLEKETRILN
jgi:hypothetical protein